MLCIIKTEFIKLKRYHILLIGMIGMAFPAILSVFTQTVSTSEAKIQNFDISALFGSTIWNSITIFMPVIFTLIGGYIINREYSDDTLKNILTVPITFQRFMLSKLITMGILSLVFGFYNYIITLLVGILADIPGMSVSILVKGLLQMLGAAICTYIAILPIVALTSMMPGFFMAGVMVSFMIGYSAMFIKDVTARSLYPVLAGWTVIRFDTNKFMNTTEPANLILSILSLACMILVTVVIVGMWHEPRISEKSKKSKKSGIFLRKGQKTK